jgi:hypothetical protein
MADLIPEEAIEALARGWYEAEFATRFRKPLPWDSSLIRKGRENMLRWAREGLEAAAPLILAAYREALLADAFPDEDSDYHYGCERLLDLVRDGIPPVVRGEGQKDG